ncbi:hypothetical protein AGOR_G00036050 [Albula goreensis]|uniref:Uncharacterized protein n=1 Tax=Albula goreensis TaxID=1534307 RepID=A0A8T3E3Y3_9TELE|nr:hypothetical protein AGOR_G00036050 [Albula goreensis]
MGGFQVAQGGGGTPGHLASCKDSTGPVGLTCTLRALEGLMTRVSSMGSPQAPRLGHRDVDGVLAGEW